MRWFARARVPILLFVLMVGTAGLLQGKSTDYIDDEACVTALPGCGDRGGDAAAWYDNCPPAAAVCDSPANQPDIGYPSLLNEVVSLRKKGTGAMFNFSPTSPAPCTLINQCDCDNADLLTDRLFNSFRRRYIGVASPPVASCPSTIGPGYEVSQRIEPAVDYTLCDATNLDPGEACGDIGPLVGADLQICPAVSPRCCLFIFKDPSGEKLTFESDPSCDVVNNLLISNGGNTVQEDLLANYIVQIKRNGINGVVEFGFQLTPTSSVVTKTVTTLVGDSNDIVADKIVAAINSAPLNSDPYFLTAVKFPNAAAAGSIAEAQFPGTFEAGQPVVRITNVRRKVATIRVKGVEGALTGQEIIKENQNDNPEVPTLSEWAMIIVALLLLGSGYWLFKRQRTLTPA